MGDLGNPHYNTAEEETEQRRADAAFLACPMCGGDDPNCELASRTPAETKSDPETENLVRIGLAAFCIATTGSAQLGQIPDDLAIRLECAAYDAIEAWRAENPQTAPCKYCGEPKPPAALCDCPGAIAQDLAGMRLAVQSIL